MTRTPSPVHVPAPQLPPTVRRLPVLVELAGRVIDDHVLVADVERGTFTPYVVPTAISGIPRDMIVLVGRRDPRTAVKWAFHGDDVTFCPPIWADIAIGSGACGFGCRTCFLMLTFRALRDPLRPVVYTNGDEIEAAVLRWLAAERWHVEGKGTRQRTAKDSIGLGIDCADSLLWEGVTGHARRLIPRFTDPSTNPRRNPLILLTKSANTHYLGQIPGAQLRRDHAGRVPGVVVSMSLNPESIADLWEGKFPDTMERITPAIDRRLAALRVAQDLGFEVRARIDPILTPDGWEDAYAAFFSDMAHGHGLRPTMLTFGTYREKNNQLATWNAKWGLPPVEWTPEKTDGRDGTHIHHAGRGDVYGRVRVIVERAFRGTWFSPAVSLCKETHAVRKAVDLCNADCNCLRGNLALDDRPRLTVIR